MPCRPGAKRILVPDLPCGAVSSKCHKVSCPGAKRILVLDLPCGAVSSKCHEVSCLRSVTRRLVLSEQGGVL